MKLNEFSWEKFFRAYKLTEKNGQKTWLARIEAYRRDASRFWALRFLYLVHFFEPRDEEANVAAAGRIVKDRLGFEYTRFYNNDNLKEGLLNLGVHLRVDKNGRKQYIRTVLFYSGWMYVRFARRIAKIIRESSWNKVSEHDFLCKLLAADIGRFGNVQDDQTEEGLTLEDVVSFFQSLARLYLRYNAPFSVEDVKDLAPLKTSVAQRIIDEMCASDDGCMNLKDLETLPQIDLDTHGQVVFGLPKRGHFAKGTETVVFQFRDNVGADARPFTFAVYNLNSNGDHVLAWKDSGMCGVPLNGRHLVRSIVRMEPNTDKPRVEVIPQVCLDTERSHILLRLRDSRTSECGYELDSSETDTGIVSTRQRLSGGAQYKVVPLNGSSFGAYSVCGAEKIAISFKDGCFRVPGNADSVVIGSDVYEVKTIADAYLNMDERVRNFNNPGRLFFERSSDLFTDACRSAEGILMEYAFKENVKETRVAIRFDEGGDWNLPESVLWRQGALICSQDGEQFFKRAVTFVDDLMLNAFDQALDIEESRKLRIRIGDDDVLVDVPPRVLRVEVACHGFKLTLPVRRTGVYFAAGKQVIPIPRERAGSGIVHDLSRRDFEKLQCRITTSSEFDTVFVLRGNTSLVRLDERSFVGNKLLMNESLAKNDSDYFALCVSHDDSRGCENLFYKFHLYDPQRENVAASGEPPHSVVWRRDLGTDDLVVTYWISFCDRNLQKHLVFYPAHKQDQTPVAFEAETSDKYVHEIDAESGRCKEMIRIPHFFREQIDWGRGLICFIAHKQVYFGEHHGYEVLSSGFFLKAPEDKVTKIGDDPYGLRQAFAGDERGHEDGETIIRIMTSKDHDVQQYVATFLDHMKDAAAVLNAYQYLNAYWNKIVRDDGCYPSGYAFMAGSYFSKIFADNVASEPYRGLWCKRLICYDNLPLTKPFSNDMFKATPYAPALHNIANPKKLEFWKTVKKVIKHVDVTGGFMVKRTWSYSYPQLSEAVRLSWVNGIALETMVGKISSKAKGDPRGVIAELYNAWSEVSNGGLDMREIVSKDGKVRQAVRSKLPQRCNLGRYSHDVFRPLFDKYRGAPYLFYGDYEIDSNEIAGTSWIVECCLSEQNIYSFVAEMGRRLHEWRKSPSLEAAQELRRIFVLVEDVDAEIANLSMPNKPAVELMEFIENVAWQEYEHERNV